MSELKIKSAVLGRTDGKVHARGTVVFAGHSVDVEVAVEEAVFDARVAAHPRGGMALINEAVLAAARAAVTREPRRGGAPGRRPAIDEFLKRTRQP